MPYGLSSHAYNRLSDADRAKQKSWWRSLSNSEKQQLTGQTGSGWGYAAANPSSGGVSAPGVSSTDKTVQSAPTNPEPTTTTQEDTSQAQVIGKPAVGKGADTSDEDLGNFVQGFRDLGRSDEEIREGLIQQGFAPRTIDRAFDNTPDMRQQRDDDAFISGMNFEGAVLPSDLRRARDLVISRGLAGHREVMGGKYGPRELQHLLQGTSAPPPPPPPPSDPAAQAQQARADFLQRMSENPELAQHSDWMAKTFADPSTHWLLGQAMGCLLYQSPSNRA